MSEPRDPEMTDGEMWRAFHEDRQARRAERRPPRQEEIRALAAQGYVVREMNDGLQFRINGALDLYPTNRRWHHLRSGDRGHYVDALACVRRHLRGGR